MQLLKANRDKLTRIRNDTMKKTIWYYTENGFGIIKEDIPAIPKVTVTISDDTRLYVSSSAGLQPNLMTTNIGPRSGLMTTNTLSHMTCSSVADAATVRSLEDRVNQLEEEVSDMRQQIRRILDAQHLLFRQETGDGSS